MISLCTWRSLYYFYVLRKKGYLLYFFIWFFISFLIILLRFFLIWSFISLNLLLFYIFVGIIIIPTIPISNLAGPLFTIFFCTYQGDIFTRILGAFCMPIMRRWSIVLFATYISLIHNFHILGWFICYDILVEWEVSTI